MTANASVGDRDRVDHEESAATVRPSPEDRCAECGDPVGHEWAFFSQDPEAPERLLKHFSGVVNAGPAEPPQDRPKPSARDFRYPDDLGVFFHSWCAPKVRLPEVIEKEFAELLARAILLDFEKTRARWARVGHLRPGQGDLPRVRACVVSIQGRRVFAMTRAEWEQLRGYEGKLVEIEIHRMAADGLTEGAARIAGLAAACSVHATEIEVWRYSERERPGPLNVQAYLVLENFTRQINLPKFAERASTRDTPRLRKHLREHVFLVKKRPDKGRWQPKAWAVERVVFVSA